MQPIYTAAPLFEGVDDPMKGGRIFLVEGERDVATLPPPEATRRRVERVAREHKVDAGRLVELPAGWREKLGCVGDGVGLHGFNRPLVAAAAAYVTQHGPGADREAFKADARAAIAAAPKREGREADLARYASDAFLDEAFASAITKFGDREEQVANVLEGAGGQADGPILTRDHLLDLVELFGRDEAAVGPILRELAHADLEPTDREAVIGALAVTNGVPVEDLRETCAGLVPVAGGTDPRQALLDRYVYVEGIERFVDLEGGELLTERQLDKRHVEIGSHTARAKCASAFYLHARGRRRMVHDLTYRPGKGLLITEERDGQRRACVNLWRPSTLALTQGRVGDHQVRPYLDHLERLIPDADAREHVLDWMAFNAQDPAEKVNHGLLLIGEEGIGKDTAIEPLVAGLGRHNCKQIGPQDLADQWTDWADRVKLVQIQEVMQFEKKQLTNSLKPFVAAPPDLLRINKKHTPPYYVPNIISVVLFSNFRDAMWLGEGDRRFFVYELPMRPLAEEYYEGLWAWLKGGGSALVFGWLLGRDLSRFNPKAPPPMTAAKREMIEASADPLAAYVRRFVEERMGPACRPLVTLGELLHDLEDVAPAALRARITEQKVVPELRRLGAERLGKVRVERGRRPCSVWCLYKVGLVKRVLGANPGDRLAPLYRRLRGLDEKGLRRAAKLPADGLLP